MQIEIEIETGDEQLLSDLLETSPALARPGFEKALPEGAVITLKDDVKRRAINLPPEIITIALSLSSSLGVNLVSTWLYEKLKGRAAKLHINRKEIRVTQDDIQHIIQEAVQAYKAQFGPTNPESDV